MTKPNIYYQILNRHARKLEEMYGIKWVPRPLHWKMCKELFECDEGFTPYTVDEVIEHQDRFFADTYWRIVKHGFDKFHKYFDRYAGEPVRQVERNTNTRAGGATTGDDLAETFESLKKLRAEERRRTYGSDSDIDRGGGE